MNMNIRILANAQCQKLPKEYEADIIREDIII